MIFHVKLFHQAPVRFFPKDNEWKHLLVPPKSELREINFENMNYNDAFHADIIQHSFLQTFGKLDVPSQNYYFIKIITENYKMVGF